ncbi:MAG: hypothetical protein N2316_08595 [Spirochaetes bacterium]|nr:hypothetical protein [Spirochaetota bacterium]
MNYVNIALGFLIAIGAVIVFGIVLILFVKSVAKLPKESRKRKILFSIIPLKDWQLEWIAEEKFSSQLFLAALVMFSISFAIFILVVIFQIFESSLVRGILMFVVLGILIYWIFSYERFIATIKVRRLLKPFIGLKTSVIKVPIIEYDIAANERNPEAKVVGYEFAVDIDGITMKIKNWKQLDLKEGMVVEITKIVNKEMVRVKKAY